MRIVVIDQLKGIALILMVIYHIIVMIPQMNLGYINTNNIFIELIGKISHTIFILTSGINLYLSF